MQQTVELREVVLTRVREQIPEAAHEAIDRALEASERAEQQMERFSEGLPPSGQDEGPPEDLPAAPPGQEGAEGPDESRGYADSARAGVEEIRDLISEGRCQEVPQALERF